MARLDSVYAGWGEGVKSLDEAALARPCGDAEGEYGHLSMAALVLHINREAIHHMAEVSLLRDLYRQRRCWLGPASAELGFDRAEVSPQALVSHESAEIVPPPRPAAAYADGDGPEINRKSAA